MQSPVDLGSRTIPRALVVLCTSETSRSSSECSNDDQRLSASVSCSSSDFDLSISFRERYELLMARLLRRARTTRIWRRTCFVFYLQILIALFTLIVVIQLSSSIGSRVIYTTVSNGVLNNNLLTQIIVITPTYRRASRLADMTRMANTLTHIENLHWIVVEDNNSPVAAVERLLNRTGLPYTYIAAKTVPGYPRRGWYQRTVALQYLRNHTDEVTEGADRSVVYFADDDNSYDIRLFNDYIRNVRKVGIWAVGLVGGVLIEMPDVRNGTVVGWHVVWNKKRKFATDMAGFAIALDVILNSTAVFGTSCKRGLGAPETCLLEDLGLERSDLEPFGFHQEHRELLVWHTKTVKGTYNKRAQDTHGFFVE
ncbi:putative glucuronosyltransferase sqv-8 [Toxocara canis]|uniref:Galactosylgalactosylxylosylprotein 3-beta-glucuronosyltransferase n=1 Tax=Toxocara canis TaxID=6265 RepID=A0A0B2VMD0_TOXCA|nr:putative glucuronosyltransferase sqv-8 [Toxocara canis]